MKDKPNYYSILPADVRYDNRLSDSEKLLYCEITSLTQSTGECWAKNEFFANLYNVSERTVTRRLRALKDLGYISVQMIYSEATNEVKKRIIKITDSPRQNCPEVVTKLSGGYRQNCQGGIDKIVEDNTTSMNTTSMNNYIILGMKEKIFDVEEFFNLHFGIFFHDWKVKNPSCDFSALCQDFLTVRGQENFHDRNHLKNSLLKFYHKRKGDNKKGKSRIERSMQNSEEAINFIKNSKNK